MKKRIISGLLIVAALFFALSNGAFAEGEKYAFVTVENSVYPKSAGAKWEGKLLDMYKVEIAYGDRWTDVIQKALLENGISVSGIEENYITEIGGVEAFEHTFYSGWMITINDWFTNYGIGEFFAKEGDAVSLLYSNDYGTDIGSDWGNSSTKIKSVTLSDGVLDQAFDSNIFSYNITLPEYVNKIKITPCAQNKNYQVRIYKNAQVLYADGRYCVNGEEQYEGIISGLENGTVPEFLGLCDKNSYISISDGDVISVLCGLDYYNSMNISDGGNCYTFNIRKAPSKALIEKVDNERKINVKFTSLNGEDLRLIFATYNKNKILSLKSMILSTKDGKASYIQDYSEVAEEGVGEIYAYIINSRLIPASSKTRIE